MLRDEWDQSQVVVNIVGITEDPAIASLYGAAWQSDPVHASRSEFGGTHSGRYRRPHAIHRQADCAAGLRAAEGTEAGRERTEIPSAESKAR